MIKNISLLTRTCAVRNSVFSKCERKKVHVLCTNSILHNSPSSSSFHHVVKRTKKNDKSSNVSALFTPVPIVNNTDDINVGIELVGQLKKQDLIRVLNSFYHKPEVRLLSSESGLDDQLMHQAFLSFRKQCLGDNLPADLHVIISDILQDAGHITDIFPYFIRHAKQAFPHLECLDDLKKISDLRTPANWYPAARAMNRKIIFHAGPTNSGKTYHALEKYLSAKSGVYCGPLKLLATEIYHKSNKRGTPCDLVTGEERRYSTDYETDLTSRSENVTEANHTSCTVEMTSLNTPYEVAIIDEIQLIGDKGRGWAWTRAILGLQAKELHLCGEAGAIPLIQEICDTTGEELEVKHYKRLTSLNVEDEALSTLDNIQPGDCIVCFSKNDIYNVSRSIEDRGKEVAVIYGSLPPGTKLAQASKFNDPENQCKVMVATDAIGLGINLSIRRIIFHSLIKPSQNEKGEKELSIISVSQALQIAGRAGRYGSVWETGYVTAFKPEDLTTLKMLLSQSPDPVTQAGLYPTAEQMELYAYHLPHASLSSLMDIFVHLCTVDDSLYFMCNTEAFKFLAEMIQHVPLPLRARYVFCCSPINQKVPFVCAMFLKMVRQYSKNDAISWNWLSNSIGWPLSTPRTIADMVHLEAVFDVMDLYLWLSYRFQDLFPDSIIVRHMQSELDAIIQQGIFQITRLLRNSVSSGWSTTEEDGFEDKKSSRIRTMKKEVSFDEMNAPKKRLSDQLVKQGLLTPRMLKQLREELGKPESEPSSPPSKKKFNYNRRNRK